jgi:zinc protease
MMANYIFGTGGNSRLWKRIREKDGLSYDVTAALDWSAIDDNTSWNVSAIFAPQNQPKVEAAFKEELARSLKDGFTQDELAEGSRGPAQPAAAWRWRRTRRWPGLVNNLYLQRTFAFGQAVDDAIQKLTLAQVNEAWRKYIQPQRLVMAWGGDFKAP